MRPLRFSPPKAPSLCSLSGSPSPPRRWTGFFLPPEVPGEPRGRQKGYLLHGARLFKEVARTRYDIQLLLHPQPLIGPLIQPQGGLVRTSDDEKGRRFDLR